MEEFVLLELRVKHANRPGESVAVVGEHPAFGCWEPSQAVLLQPNPELSGAAETTWVTEGVISVPATTPLQYKYLLFLDGTFLRWESFEGNRTITPAQPPRTIDLFDTLSVSHPVSTQLLPVAPQPQPLVGGDASATDALAALEEALRRTHAAAAARALSAADVDAALRSCEALRSTLLQAPRAEPQPEWCPPNALSLGLGSLTSLSPEVKPSEPDPSAADDGRCSGSRLSAMSNTRLPVIAASPMNREPSMSGNSELEAAAEAGENPSELPSTRETGGDLYINPRNASTVDMPAEGGVVLIVSYILPLLISRKAGGGWQLDWNPDSVLVGGHGQEGKRAGKRIVWIGCPGITVDGEAEQASLTDALWHIACVPIFLDHELQESFYKGFCRCFLWPIFHNVIKAGSFKQSLWRAYCTVNRRFADKVIEIYESGDVIWIHDYHLLLLPSVVLRKLRTARVGLFLHTPFPSSEVFRTISVRDELLRGMLNADVVGFHLFEYARHFLTCCKRMLGLNHHIQKGGLLGVIDNNHSVIVQASHAGIEPELLDVALKSSDEEATKNTSAAEAQTYFELVQKIDALAADGHRILLGIAEVERQKGLPLKLLAFRELLRSSPEPRKMTLVQVGVKARLFMPAAEGDYEVIVHEVHDELQGIEMEFPGSVIFMELLTISLEQRMQLWRRADVTLFMPIREGLNIYPLEAVYARRNSEPGVVVLSEFASTARVLNGALRVNPWNTLEVRDTLVRALEMETAERTARRERDLEFIGEMTATAWSEQFVRDLMTVSDTRDEDEQWEPLGFGLAGFRRAGWRSDFNALDTTEVLSAYRRARRRAIFLDWGGTIVPLENSFNSSLIQYYREKLPLDVKQAIEELSADPRNLLMILSGQERGMMDAVFSGVEGVSLAAEHGYFYKLSSLPGVRRLASLDWQQLIEGFDLVWKDTALAVMEAYTARTNASSIHNKGSAISWKFDDVDPEFGMMQAKELQDHLQGVLANYPVVVIMGKGYIEVRPKGINKGAMVDHVINMLYQHAGGVDFVLCIGDDAADEYMFSSLNARFAAKSDSSSSGPSVFTTVVGRKPSAARYYLNDPDEVLELCQSLRLHSTRANRNRSTSDLQRLSLPKSMNQRWSSGKSPALQPRVWESRSQLPPTQFGLPPNEMHVATTP